MTRKRQSCFRLNSSATWAEGVQAFRFPANVSSRRSTEGDVRASKSSTTEAGALGEKHKRPKSNEDYNKIWSPAKQFNNKKCVVLCSISVCFNQFLTRSCSNLLCIRQTCKLQWLFDLYENGPIKTAFWSF